MLRRICIATALLIAVTACGGDDSSSDETEAPSTDVVTTEPPPTIAATQDQTIAGTVSFDGDVGDGVIIVFAVVVGSNSPPEYTAVLDAPGPYALTGVADGEYAVQAFLDSGDDRGPPEADEPQGFYDANGDGQPDIVVMTGGAGLIEIDFALG